MKHRLGMMVLLVMMTVITGCQEENDAVGEDIAITEETVIVEENAEDVPEEQEEVEEVVRPVVPQFGGTLNISMSPADTLDPLENSIANVADVLNLIYEPLFTLAEDLSPTPVLVDSYSQLLGGTGLELTLKEGITFHDGTPLTAEDVVYTINSLRDSKTSPYKSLVGPISRASAADERTVRIYYEDAYALGVNDLIFPIVSKAYRTSADYDAMQPIGTGPYAFVDYQLMQEMDLTAFEGWHGGSTYVQDVHVIAMNETSNMETMFDQHLIDMMSPDKFNWLKYSEKSDQRIASYLSNYYDFIGFNFNNTVLQDVNLRKAIAYSIDRENIVYNEFINHAVVAHTPVMPGSWFEGETGMATTYDPEAAIALLSTSAYADTDGDGFFNVPQADGVDSSENIELRLLVNEASATRVSASELVEAYIETIGLSVTVEVVDTDVYYERIAAGDFDMVYGGWQLGVKPDYVSIFSSEGSKNYFGYVSDEMDLILSGILRSESTDLVIQRVGEFEEKFLEDMPFVSMYFLEGALMYHSNVYGELTPSTVAPLNGIDSIYLDLTGE